MTTLTLRQLAAHIMSLPDEIQDLEAYTFNQCTLIPINEIEVQYVEGSPRKWTGLTTNDSLRQYTAKYRNSLIKVALL